ncbi:hypothetical protein [Paenibacillus wynnii]|uniref:Uncharacterized protein n=1 Tax=Paenibacillus wynnii TaxID=268407 RepID=A0A098MGB7_9BACL|nr:hypothetical protein [Paenibacillus wynnii]KGE20582.1 hypothetical protein PWYN_15435 [Paenibacillus wynnii]
MNKDKENILNTVQTCFDIGAGKEFLSQLIAMFRRTWLDKPAMLAYIDDLEVRYITSLEGVEQFVD